MEIPPRAAHFRAFRRRARWAAGAPLLLLAPLFACADGADHEGRDGPPIPTVDVVTVAPELLRDVATFSGQLESENAVTLKPETDGVIASIHFEEGQRVDEGQVLFRLQDEEQRARLAEAEANVVLAQEEFGRAKNLVTRNAVSLAARDRSRAELAVARARVDLARVALERMEIRAPFAGVVGVRLVAIGDRVSDETPLVGVDAIDRLQLLFAISEQGVAFARVGVPVELRVGPYPGDVFTGEVFFVSPTLDPATRRILLKAWVPNPDGRLRPGLFANADLEIARRENAILIPESAAVFDRQGSYVWRIGTDAVAERVPVQLGLRKGGRVEVTLGLHPGDTIVTAGTHKVKAGNEVAIAPQNPMIDQALREPPAPSPAGEGT